MFLILHPFYGKKFNLARNHWQAYTNELELEVAHLLEENARLRKQQEKVCVWKLHHFLDTLLHTFLCFSPLLPKLWKKGITRRGEMKVFHSKQLLIYICTTKKVKNFSSQNGMFCHKIPLPCFGTTCSILVLWHHLNNKFTLTAIFTLSTASSFPSIEGKTNVSIQSFVCFHFLSVL